MLTAEVTPFYPTIAHEFSNAKDLGEIPIGSYTTGAQIEIE